MKDPCPLSSHEISTVAYPRYACRCGLSVIQHGRVLGSVRLAGTSKSGCRVSPAQSFADDFRWQWPPYLLDAASKQPLGSWIPPLSPQQSSYYCRGLDDYQHLGPTFLHLSVFVRIYCAR